MAAKDQRRAASAAVDLTISYDDTSAPTWVSDAPPSRVDAIEAITCGSDEVVAGRYLVLHRLGAGGCGDVDLALDKSVLGRRVALKRLPRHLRTNEMCRRRFAREARMAARVHHPAVVEIYDYDFDDQGLPYIVMEHVPGLTLSAYAQGGLPLATIAHLGLQLSEAIGAVHDEGVVHRDVKPANVMVCERGGKLQAKLIDFGLAKCPVDDSPNLDERNGICGTPQYMAPEQILGGSVDARVDVYSLACVLYELLAGEPPSGHGRKELILTRQLYTPAAPLAARGVQIPPRLERALQEALSKEPEDRPTSPTELAIALSALAGRSTSLGG